MIAVYACQSYIADNIATLPVDHFRRTKTGRDEVPSAQSPRWIRQPNPFQTSVEFWHRVLVSLLSDGNAFLVTLRNEDTGLVEALYCLHPKDVEIIEGPLGNNKYNFEGTEYDRSEILHIPAFTHDDEPRGLSPIDVAREAIGLGLTAEEFGARFFSQGTTMAGVIEHPGKPERDEARLLREMFRKTHAGTRNSHAVGVLTGGASFKPITITPEQAQFLETRKFQKTEIALLYRVPAYIVDPSVTSTWGSGIEEQRSALVSDTFLPWAIRIEQAISTFLLPGSQFIKFNFDARMRPKTAERYTAYAVAVNNGWMTLDEVRKLEDLAPIPKGLGGKHFRPTNHEVLGEPPPEPKAVAPPPEPETDTDATDQRHLPGGHNQKTHGRQRGRWRNVSVDELRSERIEQEKRTILSQSSALFPYTEDYAEEVARSIVKNELPDGTVVHVNGDVRVVNRAGKASDEAVKEAMTELEKLAKTQPLPRGVVVSFSETKLTNADAITDGNGNIVLSSALDNTDPYGEFGQAYLMPSAADGSKIRYVMAHEYGHALMHSTDPPRSTVKEYARDNGDSLSEYGLSDHKEAYAEAFAEWYLSGGTTDNEAAQNYAKGFGWKKP
ncbi:phage portal protein [Micromonospora sp. PSH03]|nr:phage portal protein [Micromonospora salmantinae]